ncbi:hypothetical protein QJS10_CPA08g00530 [Acorus calamus]|uniref:Uncharacterized protein n=1 Tax=Acorus calamus TaxID=4465 RepID=A0AAV9E8T3_ACOCL|nr:hypothetical protein QJS10_CPA08g00530 [Acorus calamus]
MLKKKDEEITNANTTVTTLKNHVFKLVGENFLWKKVAKDTAADVRTLKGELEQVKREFAVANDAGSECCGSSDPKMLIPSSSIAMTCCHIVALASIGLVGGMTNWAAERPEEGPEPGVLGRPPHRELREGPLPALLWGEKAA